MNKPYGLILVNLVGLILLIERSAIAESIKQTAVKTFQETNPVNLTVCDATLAIPFSSVDRIESRSKTGKNQSIIDPQKVNSQLPETSIWWAAEQFDPFNGNLVQNWLTYPHKKQINLTVNWQLWSELDYFGRYRFVNQFGTVLRKHGYNLNVIGQKQRCLAAYKFNSIGNPPKWELYLEKIGRDSLEVEPPLNVDDKT
ncbi:MAG: hypothetical protein AAGE96_13125 [Cyanobacteria bacterium P01_G01_bin.19]